jgi:hypothetical protein
MPESRVVELGRRQSRVNLPRELDAAETYEHVLIRHQVVGRLARLPKQPSRNA